MKDKSCDTCRFKGMESRDEQDNRIVDCEANDKQMFAPFAEDCKHWMPAIEEK